MKVYVYDLSGSLNKTIENAEIVYACKDGRHLVTYSEKCNYCKHEEKFAHQIPFGYQLTIEN